MENLNSYAHKNVFYNIVSSCLSVTYEDLPSSVDSLKMEHDHEQAQELLSQMTKYLLCSHEV